MKIWNSIHKKKIDKTIIKSIVWKSIIDIFKSEKNIDITSYLVSIQIKWNTIFIKTNKPIISAELLTINDKIKETSKKKLLNIWVRFLDFEIKYI